MLKKKSVKNIYDRTGFLWQAWVHNCTSVDVFDSREASLSDSEADLTKLLANPGYVGNGSSPPKLDSCNIRNFLKVPGSAKTHTEYPGECEHQKNTFLLWHRAQLYFYEQALQAADPEGTYGPSTKNVALPYWNFTKKPSGKRYPQVFEDPDSPLFDATRTAEPLPSSLPTVSPYLLAYVLYYLDWPAFGGDEYGTGGGGALETRMHNRMHFGYINGHMIDNTQRPWIPCSTLFIIFWITVWKNGLPNIMPRRLPMARLTCAANRMMRCPNREGLMKAVVIHGGPTRAHTPEIWGRRQSILTRKNRVLPFSLHRRHRRNLCQKPPSRL